MRKYPRPAESWTILHGAGVFDSVMREEITSIEGSLQENSGSAEGADDSALGQED